jgi:phage terminase small subunit
VYVVKCYGALTAKRQRLVEEYLVDLNATQAAIRAGYSDGKNPNAAAVAGNRLLRNRKVKAAIDEAIAERSKRARRSAKV